MHWDWHKHAFNFLKHPDWKLHSKNKDGSVKEYVRVSEN
jgi:hypothetical protein